MGLTDFRMLGRSGLAVSPAALGTMTFGNTGWGSSPEPARRRLPVWQVRPQRRRRRRRPAGGANPFSGPFTKFTERNWRVLDALEAVAQEVGRPAAQAALAWAAAKPGIACLLLGARTPEQLHANVAAMSLDLAPEQLLALDAASAPEGEFFSLGLKRHIFGGVGVEGWR